MNFTDLEKIMSSKGIHSLADIARYLNTTPQAVSNWKSRNQVPYRIVSKLNATTTQTDKSVNLDLSDNVSLSDILLVLAEQIKIIITIPAILVFLTFTYTQFIQKPLYESRATVLFPEAKNSNLGGLAGLASQFGVSIPQSARADLSSPFLFPELLRSRTFSEKIIYKEFYTAKFDKKMPLIDILSAGKTSKVERSPASISAAISSLNNMVDLEQDTYSNFSIIKIRSSEPKLSKDLADVVLFELEQLNRFFKGQNVIEKTGFIEQRISSVQKELKVSELKLKNFNEKNRQVSSPALQLELDRLEREVEIQKGIYLTLKQQLELAKIEEVQEASIVQILDKPQTPLSPSNKNIKMNVGVAFIFGLFVSILISFSRSFLNNADMGERKKIRKIKIFIKRKVLGLILDRRISGTFSLIFIASSPFYFGHKSIHPKYFGMYSEKLLIFLLLYVIVCLFFLIAFFYSTFSNKKVNQY
tara:strand:+ start:175 stop:1593 length:1419 start_codon:yes stop_codon:yes gene_type:complete